MTITDTLDEALDFVSATDGGTYDESTKTVSWTIENAEPQEWGSVEITVKVNDKATEETEIENTAFVQIGDDDTVDTNKVTDPTPDDSGLKPGTPGSGSSSSSAKTADTNDVGLWILLLAAALAGCVFVGYEYKRQ